MNHADKTAAKERDDLYHQLCQALLPKPGATLEHIAHLKAQRAALRKRLVSGEALE